VTTVSVVIPSYNRADLLTLTIRSILAQTVRPAEIIVVDDGSTDHTAAACAAFPSPVQYIRQENSGVSAARNRGIKAASGSWIAFCDSDDLWMPNKLEVQLAAITATGAGWSITDFTIIDPDGRRVLERGFRRAFPIFAETRLTADKHFGGWLDVRTLKLGSESVSTYTGDAFGMMFLGNVVIPSTSLVSREVIERVGPFDERLAVAEDTEYFHRVAAAAKVTILMTPLTMYRIGHPSLVAQKSERLIGNAIQSGERAALLRPTLTARENAAFRDGARMLRVRLAYSRLADLDLQGVREALRGAPREYILSARGAAVLAASFLPRFVLRGLHRAKRAVRSAVAPTRKRPLHSPGQRA
jgi:GT2 family glycosyltransferase